MAVAGDDDPLAAGRAQLRTCPSCTCHGRLPDVPAVSAFAGREFVLEAYRQAIAERYRFFSYGDCMLIR